MSLRPQLVLPRQWGNPEWLPVYCSFVTARLWDEINRVTREWLKRNPIRWPQ